MLKLHRILMKLKGYRILIRFSKKVSLPGTEGIPVYTVAAFFVHQLEEEALNLRASSLAFNFFLALFPAVIFFFTMLAYVPIDNIDQEILRFFQTILPKEAYMAMRETLEDILDNQRGGLLSLGFIMAMYFSTNGLNSMMNAFNKYSAVKETRKPWKQRLIAALLTGWVSLLLVFSIILTSLGQFFLDLIYELGLLGPKINLYLLTALQWLVIIGLFFTIFSSLYKYGTSKKHKWTFVSPGSLVATVLSLITTLGFSFYVNNFNSYNKLYGSIGTLIVMLLILYFNSLILLIGFELNASIDRARQKHVELEHITAGQLLESRPRNSVRGGAAEEGETQWEQRQHERKERKS